MQNEKYENTITLTKYGSVLNESQPVKKLTAEEMKQLQNLITTSDFAKIKSNKFTETCPMTKSSPPSNSPNNQINVYIFYYLSE
jgi:hypothetical protein